MRPVRYGEASIDLMLGKSKQTIISATTSQIMSLARIAFPLKRTCCIHPLPIDQVPPKSMGANDAILHDAVGVSWNRKSRVVVESGAIVL